MADTLGLVVVGLAAGMLGGLLGIGGGIVLMPFLRFCIGLSPTQAAGTCIVVVLCTTLAGSYRHYRLGHVDIRSVIPVIAAGVVATTVFSLSFLWMSQRERWLDLGIGIVFSLIAARMILEGIFEQSRKPTQRVEIRQVRGPVLGKLAIGAAGGLLPGLLGVGTGGILVPALALLLRTPIKTAVGCSLVCFSANALISSGFKYAQGFVIMGVAIPACVGALVGAYLGATLNRKFPSAGLRILFGAVFACVSLRFMLAFRGV